MIKRLYVDYYYSRQEAMWRSNALKTLPVLMNASDMLACGEDLGLVPACVPPVRKETARSRCVRLPACSVTHMLFFS